MAGEEPGARSPAGRSELVEAWPVILAGAAGLATTTVPYVTVGVFMLPLVTAFGWSRTDVAIAAPIAGLTIAVLSPLVGRLIDGLGARRIALPGAALLCVAFGLLSQISGSVESYWLGWGAVAIGLAFSSPLLWTAAIASRCRARRGAALALVLCGSSAAQAVAVPAAVFLIEHFGWRHAYIGLACAMLLISQPFLWLFFFDGRDLARARPGRGVPAGSQSDSSGLHAGMSVAQAVRSPTFWMLGAVMLLGAGSILGGIVHLIPILVDRGLTMMQGATAIACLSLSGMVGKLATGWLLDHFPAPPIAGLIFAIGAAGFGLLLAPVAMTPMTGIVIAMLLGLAGGAEIDLLSYLSARYFGLRNYAAIYGWLYGAYQVGISASPVIVGRLRDVAGSYDSAFPYLLACCLFSMVVMLRLGPMPRLQPAMT